jgi:hypothetical protein
MSHVTHNTKTKPMLTVLYTDDWVDVFAVSLKESALLYRYL